MILLLDKQNYIRFLVLFPGEQNNKLNTFSLKQVKLSANGVSKIFLKIFLF